VGDGQSLAFAWEESVNGLAAEVYRQKGRRHFEPVGSDIKQQCRSALSLWRCIGMVRRQDPRHQSVHGGTYQPAGRKPAGLRGHILGDRRAQHQGGIAQGVLEGTGEVERRGAGRQVGPEIRLPAEMQQQVMDVDQIA